MKPVLIVDDSELMRDLLAEWLEQWGYDSVCVGEAEEVAALLQRESFGLVLLDLYLGSSSGLDVLQDLRSSQPDLPVILISADREDASVAVAVEFGADDFLAKPVEPEWLRAKVERYLLKPDPVGAADVPDRYELGERVLEGYYRARDRRLQRSVLLKFGERERLGREGLALAGFCHPQLIEVFEQEPDFLVLEDYGLEVLEAVPASPHSAVTAIGAMLGLVEAVEVLHRRGFLHLGLHPGLLLGRAGGVLKICDLSGLVAHPLTASVGEFYARTGYAAPEQVDPRFGEPGPRSDQFALASILYFLLTGEAPSPGCLSTAFGEPPGLLHKLPWIDPRLEATCKRAMARHPSQRFPNLAAFRSALRPSLAEAIAQTRTA